MDARGGPNLQALVGPERALQVSASALLRSPCRLSFGSWLPKYVHSAVALPSFAIQSV
jgi:hypothetical protein